MMAYSKEKVSMQNFIKNIILMMIFWVLGVWLIKFNYYDLFAGFVKRPEIFPYSQYLVVHAALLLEMLVLTYIVSVKIDGKTFQKIGVISTCRQTTKNLFYGFLIGFVTALAVWETYIFRNHPVITWKMVPVEEIILVIALSGFGNILEASYEELLNRSWFLVKLKEYVGEVKAIILTSILFAAMHLINPHYTLLAMVNCGIFALALGLAFFRTGSLWMPIGMHAGWNFCLEILHTSYFYNVAYQSNAVTHISEIEGTWPATVASLLMFLFVVFFVKADLEKLL